MINIININNTYRMMLGGEQVNDKTHINPLCNTQIIKHIIIQYMIIKSFLIDIAKKKINELKQYISICPKNQVTKYEEKIQIIAYTLNKYTIESFPIKDIYKTIKGYTKNSGKFNPYFCDDILFGIYTKSIKNKLLQYHKK